MSNLIYLDARRGPGRRVGSRARALGQVARLLKLCRTVDQRISHLNLEQGASLGMEIDPRLILKLERLAQTLAGQ
jgi:hypothetical protein